MILIFIKKYKKTILIATGLIIILILLTHKKEGGKTTPAEYKIQEKEKVEEKIRVPKEEPTYTDEELLYRGDREFSKTLEKLHREVPYYSELPIDTEDCVIVWDSEREQFRLRLKIPESSSQELKDEVTQKAVDTLKNLTGTEFENYTYYTLYQN